MRIVRTGSQSPAMWDVEDIMTYLGCDETKANEIMENCRKQHNIKGYGAIDKHLILDFINQKQREEREREARYNSDIANAESIAVLKEQVSILREANASSSAEARKAHTQALIANIISFFSLAIAIIALVLKLN